MYLFLIIFFISLGGIVFMIGKKLVFTDIKQNEYSDESMLKALDLDEVKLLALKKAKRFGFIVLVVFLRYSIICSHFIKKQYKEIKSKIKHAINNYLLHKDKKLEEKEVSNFLKMVSDYKHRIRQIKHRIKEEEGIE